MIAGDPQVELAVELSRLERERLAKRLGRRKCCQCKGNGSCIRCECAYLSAPVLQLSSSEKAPVRKLRCRRFGSESVGVVF